MNRIREIRQRRGWSAVELAERANTTKPTIYRLETGARQLTQAWLDRLAKVLDCDPADLISDREAWRQVAIAGYIGAGQEVIPFDDYPVGEGHGKVSVPTALGSVVAAEIRGDSMYPRYEDGEVIVYRKQGDEKIELLGRDCVVRLPDGRMYLKKLQRGSKKGTFRLESHNAPPIEDQEIEWAARVRFRTDKGSNSEEAAA